MSEPSVFALFIADINQRLDRIEAALGITERTAAGKALDAAIAAEDEDEDES